MGGSAAGGAATGGAATGGVATGGVATGGAATGGAATGGAGGASAACVPNAVCSCDSYQGRNYRFCNEVLFREDALADCQTHGMTLVRVDDEAENTWLTAAAIAAGMLTPTGSSVVFLGGNQLAVNGEWRWPDGTLFWNGGAVAGIYANWESPPRNGGVADCTALRGTGFWLARACNAGDARYICEPL